MAPVRDPHRTVSDDEMATDDDEVGVVPVPLATPVETPPDPGFTAYLDHDIAEALAAVRGLDSQALVADVWAVVRQCEAVLSHHRQRLQLLLFQHYVAHHTSSTRTARHQLERTLMKHEIDWLTASAAQQHGAQQQSLREHCQRLQVRNEQLVRGLAKYRHRVRVLKGRLVGRRGGRRSRSEGGMDLLGVVAEAALNGGGWATPGTASGGAAVSSTTPTGGASTGGTSSGEFLSAEGGE